MAELGTPGSQPQAQALSCLLQPAHSPSTGKGRADGGEWFSFKFIEKGVRVVGVMRGGSGQDPSWLLWQSLAPGWCEGLTPPHWSPHPHKTPYGPGLWNGTAAPYTHTQGHLVTTTLKLRGGKRKEEKDFQCLLLGTPGQVGPFGIEGEQHGGWWLQDGDIHRDYVQRRGCPHSAPNRAELAHGGGMHVRGTAPLGVSPPDPLRRVPWRARGWE